MLPPLKETKPSSPSSPLLDGPLLFADRRENAPKSRGEGATETGGGEGGEEAGRTEGPHPKGVRGGAGAEET